MKTGIELITKERNEQLEKHGFDDAHDDNHKESEMLQLAIYILTGEKAYYPYRWNTPDKTKIFKKGRIEQLAIAGAMIAAEIDRLQRIKTITEFSILKKK